MVVKAKNRRWCEVDKDNIPLEKLAEHFEAYNRSEGKSPRTIEWYLRVVKYLADYLKQQGHKAVLGEVNIAMVRDYILFLQTKTRWSEHPCFPRPEGKLAPISVQTYVRGLRAFFNWLYREGYTTENLLADLKPPKAPSKLVEVLRDDEILRILSRLDRNTTSGCRDTAILVTMLDTGLRLSEIANLEMSDTYLDQCYVKLMGKGSKERIVPIGGVAQKALLRYIHHFRPDEFGGNGDKVFLSVDGRPLSGNAIRLILSRLAVRSGVKRLHPHLCRHTFATKYLINGGDVFSLQQILGHTTLEMVRRYVTLASSQVRVQHRKYSPMDRMNLGRVMLGGTRGNGNRKKSPDGNWVGKQHNFMKNGS